MEFLIIHKRYFNSEKLDISLVMDNLQLVTNDSGIIDSGGPLWMIKYLKKN